MFILMIRIIELNVSLTKISFTIFSKKKQIHKRITCSKYLLCDTLSRLFVSCCYASNLAHLFLLSWREKFLENEIITAYLHQITWLSHNTAETTFADEMKRLNNMTPSRITFTNVEIRGRKHMKKISSLIIILVTTRELEWFLIFF